MKIVIIQGAFLPVPPILGGAVEKIWFRMGREFAAAGHDVSHISRNHPDLPDSETLHGVRHIRVRGYDSPRSMLRLKFCDLLYSLRVLRRIPRDADVIVTNTFWMPIFLRGRRGGKAVVDVQRVPKGQLRLYSHVGRLRANSSPIATAIRSELPTALHEKVCMIPNPLPFDAPELIVGERDFVLLYVGRLHPEKGLDLLIKAFARLRSQVLQGWKLRIVGPWKVGEGGGGESYFKELKSLAGNLPIEFTGPIYDASELDAEYRGARIFCYPSVAEKGETFGLAPLEAMALGCVPVVSNLACFQDFIVHGTNGLVFDHRQPMADALLAQMLSDLMDNPDDLHRMAERARLVAQTHSPREIAKQFLAEFACLQADS